jgi:replication factor C subunit 3/5
MDQHTYVSWNEKYRPTMMDNVIYHNRTKKSISYFLKNKKLPNILLHGNAGLGKTSLITACLKEHYGDLFQNNVKIINASEKRGVQTIRDEIIPYCKLKNVDDIDYRIVVLDEVDSMTYDAQTMLRGIIESYPNRIRFILICNYINKINIAMHSRLILYKFKQIDNHTLYDTIINISCNEHIRITKKAVNLLIKYSKGDLRKIINILQSLHLQTAEKILINSDFLKKIILFPDNDNIHNIIHIVKNNNLINSINIIKNIITTNNFLLNDVIIQMYHVLFDMLLKRNYDMFDKYDIINFIQRLAELNTNVANSHDDKYYIISFISIFYVKK